MDSPKDIEYKRAIKYKSIKDWRLDDRPREKLIKNGASSLSDAELIAIIIRAGTKMYSAIDVARDLLDLYGNLSKLASCDISELQKIRGIGKTKAVQIAAVFELVRRVQSEPYDPSKIIRSPEDVAKFYIPRFRNLRQETFWVLMLNASNQIIREMKISEGILDASIVHPREVFRIAITESAASIILLHNHPSGNPQPSNDDIKVTKKLVQTGEIIDIKVLDHLIIAGDFYTSMKKLELM